MASLLIVVHIMFQHNTAATTILTAILVFQQLIRECSGLSSPVDPRPSRFSGQSRRKYLEYSFSSTAALLSFELASPNIASALDPREAASQYDTYASSYDSLDGGKASSVLGIDEARAAMISRASGKVLEIGVGTGLNLDKYVSSQIESLTLVDISPGMLKEAAARLENLPNLRDVPIHIVTADATSELATRFGSDTFDTVVDSFSLCVMGNEGAKQCLDQIVQVVKPGGNVLLLENSRSSNPLLGIYQDVTADAAAFAGGKGCVYNQDVRSMIETTRNLEIREETLYAAGLFRAYNCKKV